VSDGETPLTVGTLTVAGGGAVEAGAVESPPHVADATSKHTIDVFGIVNFLMAPKYGACTKLGKNGPCSVCISRVLAFSHPTGRG
jgi:hypothetical protein